MRNLFLNNKYKLILTLIIILLLIILLLFSYSFFSPGVKGDNFVEFNATGNTLDEFIFSTSGDLSLSPGSYNLYENSGNLKSESTISATLKSYDTSKTIFAFYNIYFNIYKNSYDYSNPGVAELILTITDNDGNIVSDVNGLNFVTVNGVSGFDVTESVGLFSVKLDKRIESNSYDGVTEDWLFELTLINLNENQDINQLKEFSSEIIIQQEKIDLLNLKNEIIEKNGGVDFIENRVSPDFSLAVDYNDGMYAKEDDYGISYYYRGYINDNWVYFGGYYWQILRINGDGSIKLIYGSNVAPKETETTGISSGGITTAGFISSESNGNAEAVGYMYEQNESHGYRYNSLIKNKIDTWYEENLINYDMFLSDVLFCNDRVAYSDTAGTNLIEGHSYTSYIYFNPYIRLNKNEFTFKCENKLDSFTVDDLVNGNGALKYPVGLITIDEAYAYNIIYTTVTMSPSSLPYRYRSPLIYRSSATSDYIFEYSNMHAYDSTTTKPVINLKSNTLVTGSGTFNDPYVVKGLE